MILFSVVPIICGISVFGPSFVMQYLVSFLVLQSSSERERERDRQTERARGRQMDRERERKRERAVRFNVIVFLMYSDSYCSVAIPHGALG